MQTLLVPELAAIFCIEAIDPVVPGAEKHPAAGNMGTGLEVAGGREAPELLSRIRSEAIETALTVLVESLSDKNPAGADRGR